MSAFEMLITPLATIAGVLIGSYSTYRVQVKINDKEYKRELHKEKQQTITECLEIYNEILKLDGENILVTHLGGSSNSFEITTYQEKIRPVLYLKFHLLHKDVAGNLRSIDKIISEATYYEELNEDQESFLITVYQEMIFLIEKHVGNLRISYS